MKKILFILLLITKSITGNCQPAPGKAPYFQQKVNYKINVTLSDIDNSLDGSISIDYTNNSPDTLSYIWFHLWPNAFKNDKTAFSDQLLENGRTGFYFSDNERRGYINRLNFKVNGLTARLDDHPQYIDISKLILPVLLAPGGTVTITSPFHVKLPYNFSLGGYVGHTYQVTQWYPKPAVYDARGWHPIPYLDQGEFYSEFGNFDVQITLPKEYVVAATGELQNEDEKKWLTDKSNEVFSAPAKESPKPIVEKKLKKPVVKYRKTFKKNVQKTVKGKLPTPTRFPAIVNEIKYPTETKTLHYLQENVHDFAWFADKRLLVRADTLQLASGRIIKAQSFFLPRDYSTWKNSIQFIKYAVRTRSRWLGEYPYNVVTAVEAQMGFSGGMEYPTITSITPMPNEKELDLVIEHEVGHNWNYGILGSNERDHPWMDEGMNTYFDNRYEAEKYPKNLGEQKKIPLFFTNRLPESGSGLAYRTQLSIKKDQPVETTSEKFTRLNYSLVAYYKTGLWMKVLEDNVGKDVFDSCFHEYFNRWKFKHPYPEDFKKVVEDVSGKNVDSIFSLLDKRGDVVQPVKKQLKLVPLFSFKETNKYNYIFISPSFGVNYYDKLMIGGLIHNYTLPANHFQFFATPMYGLQSKKLTGLARIAYNWTTYGAIQKGEISLNGASFSVDDFTDSAGNVKYLGFNKLVPSLKIVFREKNDRSNSIKWLQWKTFFIREEGLSFTRDTVNQVDVITYPKTSRYLNQLKFVIENNRVLYPYKGELQAEQGEGFIRTVFNGNYFFNYTKSGGLNVRLFAGKFLYTGDKTFNKQFTTDRYHLNMTGANGYEDYTYSNYFIGRNEFTGASSQQIMIRDGGFKVRTDLLAAKVGKTDDWLAAVNFKTDLPKDINPLEVLPIKIPLKIFLDVGTYAEAWNKNAATGKFIYDAGLQISVLHDLVNIYIPVVYSKVYSAYFKSTITGSRFLKNISFSIDIQNFKLKNVAPQMPF